MPFEHLDKGDDADITSQIIDLLGDWSDEQVLSALDERRWAQLRYRRHEGYVYLCKNNRNGYIKIGWSKSPSYREKTLQSEEPDVCFIATYAASRQDERWLHDKFALKRLRGEWFSLDERDVAMIDDHYCEIPF